MNSLSAVIWGIVAVLFVVWLVGLIVQTTFGGLIHLLLILILVAVVIEVIRTTTRTKQL